jgi:hypothetical protein
LTYWVVYAFFAVLELFGDNLVFWVPFYYELKIAILLLLQLPQFKFASQVYIALIQPWFRSKEKDIDALLEKGQSLINVKIQQGLAYLASNGPAFMAALFTAAATWHAQPAAKQPAVASTAKKPFTARIVEAVEESIKVDVQAARKGKGFFDQSSAPPPPSGGAAPSGESPSSVVDELKKRHGGTSAPSTPEKKSDGVDHHQSQSSPHVPIPTEPGAREGERPPQLMDESEEEPKKDR